jgi:colicin import membrane protein
MPREPKSVKTDARSWVYSLLLHGVLLVLVFVGLGFGVHSISAPPGTGSDSQPVEAKVVSQKEINQQLAEIKASEAKKKAARQAAARKRKQRAAAARKAREQEQQRLAKLKKEQQAEQEKATKAAAERKHKAAQEQKELAKLEANRKASQQRAAKAKAQAEAARKKAAAAAAARKKKAEEEARRKAAEAKRRKQEAAEAAQRKSDLQKELAKEKSARKKAAQEAQAKRERSKALGNYKQGIKQKVVRNWNVPAKTPDELNCVVDVTQVPGGEVVNARITTCNADRAVQQSIISAVYKASPLPEPSDSSLFAREIEFTFTNEDVGKSEQ